MSEIKIYYPELYYSINEMIKYMDKETECSFYEYKLCYNKLFLILPNDMWKLIIQNLIMPFKPIKSNNINDCLEYFDYYITHPIQQQFNPLFLTYDFNTAINTPLVYLLIGQYPKSQLPIDISFQLCKFPLKNNSFSLPFRIADLFVGIKKNSKIKGININFPSWSFYYDLNKMYEYKLINVYTHTYNELFEITDTKLQDKGARLQKSDLCNPKFKNNDILEFWSLREIMPMYCTLLYDHQYILSVVSEEVVDEIELLCAYVSFPEKNNYSKIYKNMIYNDGCYIPLKTKNGLTFGSVSQITVFLAMAKKIDLKI